MTIKANVLFSHPRSFEGESGETISGFWTGVLGTFFSGGQTCAETWTRQQFNVGDTVKLVRVKRGNQTKVYIFPWDE